MNTKTTTPSKISQPPLQPVDIPPGADLVRRFGAGIGSLGSKLYNSQAVQGGMAVLNVPSTIAEGAMSKVAQYVPNQSFKKYAPPIAGLAANFIDPESMLGKAQPVKEASKEVARMLASTEGVQNLISKLDNPRVQTLSAMILDTLHSMPQELTEDAMKLHVILRDGIVNKVFNPAAEQEALKIMKKAEMLSSPGMIGDLITKAKLKSFYGDSLKQPLGDYVKVGSHDRSGTSGVKEYLRKK